MTKHDSAKENQEHEVAQDAEHDTQQDIENADVETQQDGDTQPEQKAGEAQGDDVAALNEQVAELELALAQAEQRAEESKDRAVRAVAEMENVRRRAAMDVEKAHKFALEKFANELLTTVDNLERALAIAANEDTINANFLEGIELTHKSLLTTLQKFGVEAVGEEGETFNPDLHQAMSMQAAEGKENNTILAVMQKGYTLSGRLLRPAMVMVVKN
ncbi:nucleotide exchange factor GrpE [Pseudidiomarina sp. 1APP75-32.1]|uniref:Protein GrpE n=1 Tax=Pseudidiomarina terrestris TaxID=2820060 RepID=A0AAW7QWW2_9GAMM|nr:MULTISPECIES: nucleotide exchange factor GrpE [unclassified Pseudidiomarina]MDN7123303.1 nucleotide exchange factor GrpE [Pseudidiomarina sp. 1APP75-32.1]MDN7128972.1 nucleotide exchange factor GrpE [Pseudidiomarina sp. 1APR75-15]